MDRGGGEAQGARAGDDQHGCGDQHRVAQLGAHQQPGREGHRGGEVHDGHVELRRPQRPVDIAGARALGRLDHPGDARERGVVARRGRLDQQRGGEVEDAGVDLGAHGGGLGPALAGDHRAVEVRGALDHPAVGGGALSGGDLDQVAGAQVLDGDDATDAALRHHGGGEAGVAPRAVVQHPAQQQEEAQRHGGVEIGVGAALGDLEQADAGREDQGEADRHVHVDVAVAQHAQRRAEEGHAGERGGRQRDQRRNPVQQVAGGVGRPGPDRDREQHHVHHRKARDGEAGEQVAPLAVTLGVVHGPRVEGAGGVADPREGGDHVLGLRRGGVVGGRDATQAEVDAGRAQAGGAGQRVFDALDAGGAVDAGDEEVEPPQPLARVGDEARQPAGAREGGRGAGGAAGAGARPFRLARGLAQGLAGGLAGGEAGGPAGEGLDEAHPSTPAGAPAVPGAASSAAT